MINKISIKKRSIYTFPFYLLIFSEIFNTNRFVAALRFTMIPTILSFVFCLLSYFYRERTYSVGGYFYLLIVGIITVISVFTSNIVSWTASTSSFIIYLILFVLMTNCELTQSEIKHILVFYFVLCIIISTQIYINVLLSRNYNYGRVSFSFLGVIKDQNIVSAFLTFGAYFAFSVFLYKRKNVALISFLFIFLAMMFDGSRGGMLSVVIACFILFVKWLSDKKATRRKILVCCFLFVVIGAGIFVFSGSETFARVLHFQNYTNDSRIALWRLALQGFYNRPLIGQGYDSGTYYSEQYWNLGAPTHNSFIDMLTSVGILGCIAYFLFAIKQWSVPKGERLFIVGVGVALLFPLFFINGYGSITFMMPCAIISIIASFCKKNKYENLIS